MTETSGAAARTYGNWRKPRSPGLGRLGLAGTLVLMAGLVAVIAAMAINLVSAVVVAGGLGLVLLPFVAVDGHGRNGFQAVGSRAAFWAGRRRGCLSYRSGPLSPVGRFCLPGLAAGIQAHQATDGYGAPFVLLAHPRTGHVTAVLQTSPEGAALVDPEQTDLWVAGWGEWLNTLGKEPGLVAASVTVETAPDPGGRLARHVQGRVHPEAPALARRVLADIVDTYPAGSAQATCRVALTWTRTAGGRRRTIEAMAVDVGRRLPGLALGLQATGAGPARAMTETELAGAVRVAYDPDAQGLVDAAGGQACDWADCGPAGTTERFDCYHHDGATSISWSMTQAPRGVVHSGVLAGLLGPHPDVARKRVTLLYRPYTPAQAAGIVERDRKDTLFRANASKVARARDLAEVAAATKTAEEDARGAGLVRFGMIVTATVAAGHPDAPALAKTAVEGLAVAARVGLRPVYRSQATAFLAGLPLGLVVPDHLRIPTHLREAL